MDPSLFPGFEPSLFQFLEELAGNNNRPWFQQNKGRYEREVLEPAMAFIRAFQPRLKRVSPYFVASDRRVGGSLMRVYRDTRFARDSEPLKTNVGIQFRHELGRDIHAPGFYVHIAPDECFLAVGLWRPEPDALGRIRQAIVELAPALAPGKQRAEVPGAILLGRQQPEAAPTRLPGRPSLHRRHQADRFHRRRRTGGARRFGQGIPGPRGGIIHRQSSLHAISMRRAESALLTSLIPLHPRAAKVPERGSDWNIPQKG